MAIWHSRLGGKSMTPAERVLDRCRHVSVYCWSSTVGALEMALFLELHSDPGGAEAPFRAKAMIAYRSFHPELIEFTWEVLCHGGQVDAHDVDAPHHIMTGRTAAEACRSNVLPCAVGVERGPDGAQVEAHIQFHQKGPQVSDGGIEIFSVAFPSGEDLQCPCC